MDSIKAVVFDMDGVLRIGDRILPFAKNILDKLEKRNIKTMIVTNECRYSVDELREDLEDMGLIVPNSCGFFTAALSAKEYFEKKILKSPDKKFNIGIVGELGLFLAINELKKYKNFNLIETLDNESNNLYLVIGAVNRIKINYLNKILKWIKAGAKILTTCSDACDPASKGDFILGMPNHMLHMVGYNIKTKSYSTGKPNPLFKNKIMKFFNRDEEILANEILFVGDTIYTDIQLAEESDFKSCLVLSGNSNIDTIKSYINEPDYIIESVKNLYKLFNLEN